MREKFIQEHLQGILAGLVCECELDAIKQALPGHWKLSAVLIGLDEKKIGIMVRDYICCREYMFSVMEIFSLSGTVRDLCIFLNNDWERVDTSVIDSIFNDGYTEG